MQQFEKEVLFQQDLFQYSTGYDLRDLKPCPFCGSQAILSWNDNVANMQVKCMNPLCHLIYSFTARSWEKNIFSNIKKKWNKRV